MGLTKIQNEFMKAIRGGDLESAEGLLEQGANVDFEDGYGSTPLLIAARNDDAHTINWLLRNHANGNGYGLSDFTPLTYAVFHYSAKAIKALLLTSGINVNLPTLDGETPLILAVDYTDVDVVCRLLEAGADPTIKDKDGRTALEHAKEGNQLDVIKTLEEEIQRRLNV